MNEFTNPSQVPSMDGSNPTPQSQWPAVIGAIAIAFGCIVGIGALWSVISTFMLPPSASPGVPVEFVIPDGVKTWVVIDCFLGFVFSTMLLVGGLSVIRRRAGGVTMLRSYAIIRLVALIPLAIGQGWASSATAEAMFEAMEKQSQADAASASSDTPASAGSESDTAAEADGGGIVAEGDAAATNGGMKVTSKDGTVEVSGGTVESRNSTTTVITDSKGTRVVISGTGSDGSSKVVVTKGGKGPPSNAQAMRAMEPFMPAIMFASTACAALLAAIWPIVLLVVLSNARRKEEVRAWPAGI